MKTLLPLFVLMAILAGCKNAQIENEAFIKTYFENFNKHDWKAMSEMYAPSAEFLDPSFGTDLVQQKREDIVKKYSEMEFLFPDLHDEVKHIHTTGENTVIVQFISTGTAPENLKFTLPICTIFTIENGQIVKDYTYYDNF